MNNLQVVEMTEAQRSLLFTIEEEKTNLATRREEGLSVDTERLTLLSQELVKLDLGEDHVPVKHRIPCEGQVRYGKDIRALPVNTVFRKYPFSGRVFWKDGEKIHPESIDAQ